MGSPKLLMPPQRLLFPVILNALSFLNTPSCRTSPLSSLKDKFSRRVKFCRYDGISSEMLFLERSRTWRLFSVLKIDGKVPLNKLLFIRICSNIKQLDMGPGISPMSLFWETSNSDSRPMFPNSGGKGHVKEFRAKLKEREISNAYNFSWYRTSKVVTEKAK